MGFIFKFRFSTFYSTYFLFDPKVSSCNSYPILDIFQLIPIDVVRFISRTNLGIIAPCLGSLFAMIFLYYITFTLLYYLGSSRLYWLSCSRLYWLSCSWLYWLSCRWLYWLIWGFCDFMAL